MQIEACPAEEEEELFPPWKIPVGQPPESPQQSSPLDSLARVVLTMSQSISGKVNETIICGLNQSTFTTPKVRTEFIFYQYEIPGK